MLSFWGCNNGQNIDDDFLGHGVVINEINYNSSDSFNPDDWVEIYNNGDTTVDLSSWSIKDENDDHIFMIPLNTILLIDQYIVFCKDTLKLLSCFPDVNNYCGDLGFGFSGGSDIIRLFDSGGLLVDQVEYDDGNPWPSMADGSGPTLELKNPNLDNANWENWSASNGNGTPGRINSNYNGY
ncbi:MAG: lamin tail domain-containing protein [Candidatus Neomarinimicrobiota bacterium]